MPILVDVLKNFFRVAETQEGEISEVSTHPLEEWDSFWASFEGKETRVVVALPAPLVFTCSRFYGLGKEFLEEILDFEIEKTVVDLDDVIHVEVVEADGGSLLILTELTQRGEDFLEPLRNLEELFVSSRPLFLCGSAPAESSLLVEMEDDLLTWCFTSSGGVRDLGEMDLSPVETDEAVNTLALRLKRSGFSKKGIKLVAGGDREPLERFLELLSSELDLEKFEITDDISGVIRGMHRLG